MFKSTIVFALALLSVADGKRIWRGEKKQQRRRELRGGNNGGNGGGSSSSSSSTESEPVFTLSTNTDPAFFALRGMSGEILDYTEDDNAGDAPICGPTSCTGNLVATAEGYECDPDDDNFEDTCLDVIVGIEPVEVLCPEPTDVMRIQTATCVCTGPMPSGACTPNMMLTFNGPEYQIPAPMTNTCAMGQFAISATLVCESVVAGSSSSSSTSGSSTGSSGSSTGSSGSSTGKSSSTTNRRQ